jgi:LysM repeat protein
LLIASAYGVELSELLTLNGLTAAAVIFPGDELIIKLADATPTYTLTSRVSTPTATGKASATARPTRTPIADTPTPDATALAAAGAAQTGSGAGDGSQSPSAFVEFQTGIDPMLVIIVVLVVAGTGLVLFGALAKRNP